MSINFEDDNDLDSLISLGDYFDHWPEPRPFLEFREFMPPPLNHEVPIRFP